MARGNDDNFWHKNSTRSSGSPLLMVDFREFVEKRWPWLQAKIGTPNPPSNPSGPPALSEFEAKAFVEGVETAQDA